MRNPLAASPLQYQVLVLVPATSNQQPATSVHMHPELVPRTKNQNLEPSNLPLTYGSRSDR